MDVDEALDTLYAAPIDEFTATRNALAKELGPQGAAIKSLKKPNLAAWAVNQLARSHPDELDELFAVTDKLRHAQRRVMSGGKASDLRAATDARNRVVSRLTRLVERILTDAGHAASQSTLSAAGDSFVAVASDEVGGELLKKGRLTRELAPGSIMDVGGLTLVADREDDDASGTADGSEQTDRERIRELKRVRDETRAALRLARDALKQANNDAARLEIEADQAAKRARSAAEQFDFARRAAEARRADVEAAEQAVAEAEKAVKDAEN